MTLLELNSVNAYYGKSHILHEISLDVESEEIVTLLGRNGAGKSTTIKSVLGVVPRVEGRIMFKGESITRQSPDEVFNRGISWVPQSRRIFSTLSVEENLEMGVKPDQSQEAIQRAYDRVFDLFPRLQERLDQRGGTLSGGEKQMLVIGRALVSEPDMLLVDEPFEGLMPTLIPQIVDVFDQLRRRGVTIFLAEQKIQDALELSDRTYIIDSGEIVYAGASSTLADDKDLQEQYIGIK